MATTGFEKIEMLMQIRGKIADYTNQASDLTTDCSEICAIDMTNLNANTPPVTAPQLKTGIDAYNAIRSRPSTQSGGHSLAAMPNTALVNEIMAEAAEA